MSAPSEATASPPRRRRRTPEGSRASAANAVTHGLTSRVLFGRDAQKDRGDRGGLPRGSPAHTRRVGGRLPRGGSPHRLPQDRRRSSTSCARGRRRRDLRGGKVGSQGRASHSLSAAGPASRLGLRAAGPDLPQVSGSAAEHHATPSEPPHEARPQAADPRPLRGVRPREAPAGDETSTASSAASPLRRRATPRRGR